MSGGSLDYFYTQLEDHIGDFKDKELDELVEDLAMLFHSREWYLSGDIGEGGWNEARDNFKKKWFTDIGRQERITKYLDDTRNEVLQSFGLYHQYCRDCKYWTAPDKDHTYGECSEHPSCRWHPCETCEDWEDKNG